MKARNQKMNQYNKWISLASLSLLSAAALQVADAPEVFAEANPGSASSGWVQERQSFKSLDEAMTYGNQHADWSKYKQYRVNYVGPNRFVLKWELKNPQNAGKVTEPTSPVKTNSEKPVETTKPAEKPAGSASYTVQSGDSLWRISNKYGVSIQDLMSWNNLGANYMLHPGDKLVVKAPAKAEVPTAKPSEPAKPVESTTSSASYTVQSGDSLWRISNKYGVSIQDLMTWNKLGANYMLHPGDKLVVQAPAKAETPTTKPSEPEKPVESTTSSASYTVQSGDSLWRISNKYGVSIQDLMTWNNLGANYMLHPGDKLVVQAPAKAESPTTKPSTAKPAKADTTKVEDGWRKEDQNFKSVSEAMAFGRQHADWSKYKQYRVDYAGNGRYVLKWELRNPEASSETTKKPAEPTETATPSASYTVQSGDSLWRISNKYGVSIQDLMTWNKLGANYMLHPGDKLVVKAPAKAEVPTTKPSTDKPAEPTKPAESASYTVQSGDSLWRISNKYGVSIQDLMTWNKLGANYMLHPGDKLVVKAPAKAETATEKPAQPVKVNTKHGFVREPRRFSSIQEALNYGNGVFNWRKYKKFYVNYAGPNSYTLDWELR
ncbi:LysM peptidoglycan-binding domain-containing protein [Aerococcus urinae]|uniref:LysM peptidoglycan-binding domain-containing protein n=1 Tax=Aerococcus urinae TaxID=1376 RepID=UPI00254BC43F|nr:LysM peptidoglycan-binding domain-containing protein [Aerococcus urinae]MDK6372177.1 LysM peptidoglycan-binding domain-containing protein [Aerococcus urinae]